jgi:hypothetical protein
MTRSVACREPFLAIALAATLLVMAPAAPSFASGSRLPEEAAIADRQAQAFPRPCVVLIHHNNRAGGFRGNSSVDGALNTVLTLKRDGDGTGDTVTAHIDKQKDAQEIEDFRFRRKLVDISDGTPESEWPMVLEWVGWASQGGAAAARAAKKVKSVATQEDRMLHVANALMNCKLSREHLRAAVDATGVELTASTVLHEYSPSRRSSAPLAPLSHRLYSARILALYCAEKVRRLARSGTSASTGSLTGPACRPATMLVTTNVNCGPHHALLPGVFRFRSASPNVDTKGGDRLVARMRSW